MSGLANPRVCFDCGRPASFRVRSIGKPSVIRFVCDRLAGAFLESDLWTGRRIRGLEVAA
jgi:hypothetical protein